MKKLTNTLISIVILLIAYPSFAQQVESFQIHDIQWSGWDKYPEDMKGKEFFLSGLSENGVSLQIDSLELFKIVDIDGKNELDVIKLKNGDTTDMMIFINTQNSLKRVFSENENIVEINRMIPINPVSFKTMKTDSATLEIVISHYDFTIMNEELNYMATRTELIKMGTQDVYKNMPPTFFRVKRSGTPIVVGPGLQTLIRTCSQNEIGYAIGSVKTNSGELWWKVYLQEPGYKLRMGWLKRGDVLTEYQK
jgi:hypothetical protein